MNRKAAKSFAKGTKKLCALREALANSAVKRKLK